MSNSSRKRWGPVIASALAMLLLGCPGDTGTGSSCTVISVTVLPGQISLNVSETANLTASFSTSNCDTPPAITWLSSDPTAVSVQGNGSQAQVTGLLPTTAAVTVSATAGTVSGGMQVTVLPPPAIALNPSGLSFTASQGGADPTTQITTITNNGAGALSGLNVGTITYGAGATGWLQAPTLSGTTASPAVTITVQPVTGSLTPGTYTATIPVQSGVASNSPQNVTVTFTVTPPPPAIALNPTGLTFTASQGGANPASQVTTITNSGGGTLSGLSIGTITYGAEATGWLQVPILSGTSANPSVTLTVQPVTGGLTPGTYTATIPVQSAVASNSPQDVTVTFIVTPSAPAIALNPASLTYTASRGGANPASQVTTITNSGGGTLSGLGIGTITYGAGAAGWLQAPVLSGTTANPSVTFTVQPVTGGLSAGTYTATIPVQSGVATNSPQNVTVTFTVLDPCLFANAMPIAVGQTINGTLSAATSCLLPSGRYADLYGLTLNSATNVVLDLTSSVFDPVLTVLDFATGTVIEEDDDGGPGLNSHIARNLAAGQYIIRPRSFSTVTGQYTLSVQQATVGPPASVAINAGNAQIAAPSTNVPIAPSVIVRDANGFGVPGVTVTFATVPTIGSVTGATAVTRSDGVATVGSWNVAAGPNALSATASGASIVGNPAIFSATGSLSAAGYDVDLRFLTMPTLSQLQTFANAVTRWQTIITSELANINFNVLAPNCAANSPPMNEVIDDLVIQVTLEPIDGPGTVLGSAGPCYIRTAGSLPVLGTMRFDVEDLATLEASGSLDAVILHEMGHVIGIGTLWTLPEFNLLANPSLPNNPGVDTRYTGVNGIVGFDSIGGTTYTGSGKVPVENSQGGAGTRDAHWRESVLVNELLTGFLDPGSNPLSLLTVRSLQDFGYAVNTAAADPFFLVLTVVAEGGSWRQGIHLLDDIRSGPIYRVDQQGRITDLRGRPIMAVPGKQ